MVIEIQYLKGVGPKRAAALAKIGIHTLTDLIDFYPRKYLDRTTIVAVNKIRADEEFTVVGRVEAQGIHRWRKRAQPHILSSFLLSRFYFPILKFNYATCFFSHHFIMRNNYKRFI